jgi:hypothetical protein
VQGYGKCADGKEAEAVIVLENACHARLRDMYHDAHIQCVISHYRNFLGEVIKKERVRQKIILQRETNLTEEVYLMVINQETFVQFAFVKHSFHLLTCQILDVSLWIQGWCDKDPKCWEAIVHWWR